MKILRAIRSVNSELGGPVEGLIQSSKVLIDKGHTVEVVSIDSPDDPYVKSFPLKLYTTGPGKGKYGFALSYLSWLDENVNNYDCVIIEGLWQFHGYGVSKACHRNKVPYFIFIHGMLNPWSKKKYPLKHLKKWVYWFLVEYKILKNASAVLCTNSQEREEAKFIFWPNNYNAQVVQFGTSTPPSDANYYRNLFLDKFPETGNKRCLLFLSRIHPKKGCDLLIEAFARIKKDNDNLHLIIVGPDETGWKKELAGIAEKYNVQKHITWTGMLSGDLKWGAYYNADAFILPSRYENFGIVVVEALGCGLPVLISDKINICHVIEKEEAGLVEEDTIKGTENLINRYLALSDEKRNIIANNAKKCFLDKFGIESAANSLLNVIESNI